MKFDWQLIGEWATIGAILGYMAYDAYVDWSINRKSLDEQKTSKYVGWFSFMTVDKANGGTLYFGDKPWKNQNLESRTKTTD